MTRATALFHMRSAGSRQRASRLSNSASITSDRARVVRAARIVADAFAVIAACARDGEIARVVGIDANARGERSRGAFAEPRLRYDVFQRRVA
jgi:hypothetical protein